MIRYATRIMGVRKVTAIVLRCFIILLLICLIADIKPYTSTEQKNMVMLVDRSASVGDTPELIPFLNEIADHGEDMSRQAIVSFAKDIAIDRPIAELQAFPAFRTRVSEAGTLTANAIRQAAGMLGKNGGGRILLLSDGFETGGEMLREVELLQSLNIAVDVVPISPKQDTDAAISAFKVPGHLKAGEKYQMSLTIQSTDVMDATVIIYEDDRIIKEAGVRLVQGENTFVVDQIASEAGLHKYRAVVQAASDTEPINNNAFSISRTEGPVGVLLVEGNNVNAGNVGQALASSYFGYTTIKAEQLSYELADYLLYDSIIFNNVSAINIPQRKMDMIASAVRNYGVGFVMLGGDESFGVGGYFDTPIEDILPVNMELTGKRQLPKLGLMLVIDHSGSMSGDNIELAKEAAIRTVEMMRPVDTVSVIAFDDKPTVVVPPTLVQDQEEIIRAIQSIQAAGGTDIYPAIKVGYEHLLEMASERKHMILLTDGVSATNVSYKQLTDDMVANNMTMSTVAVGDGADTNLLNQLAEAANGRYYFTNDQSTIPAIFSREAVMMSRAYVVEQTFEPKLGYAGSWNQLWNEGIPTIDAYVATSAKDLAEVALYTTMDDPLLARWNVGAGKSVAFTSDVNGNWASDWVQWSQFSRIFNEWIKWTYPQFVSTPYSISVESSRLIVTSNDETAQGNLSLVLNEAEEERQLPLIPIGNGQYEVEIGELESGIYFTQIGEKDALDSQSTALSNAITTGFVVPYSKEYELHMDNSKGENELLALAEQTGGRVLGWEDAATLYQFEPVRVKDFKDWSRIILIILCVLWLLDIGNRRLSFAWYGLNDRLTKWRSGLRRSARKEQDWKQSQVNTSIDQLTGRKKAAEASRGGQFMRNSQQVKTDSLNDLSNQVVDRSNTSQSVPTQQTKTPSNSSRAEEAIQQPNDAKDTSNQSIASHHTSSTGEQANKDDKMNRLLAAKNRNKR